MLFNANIFPYTYNRNIQNISRTISYIIRTDVNFASDLKKKKKIIQSVCTSYCTNVCYIISLNERVINLYKLLSNFCNKYQCFSDISPLAELI